MQIPPAPCPSPLVSSRVVSIPSRSLAEYPATSPAHKIPPWSQCLPALSPTAADLTHCLPTITAHQWLQGIQDKLGQNFTPIFQNYNKFFWRSTVEKPNFKQSHRFGVDPDVSWNIKIYQSRLWWGTLFPQCHTTAVGCSRSSGHQHHHGTCHQEQETSLR